ncbi:MAG: DUF4105 domain-containing protein [Oligoflexia bacterium]|nr:DUF4105 domain-containing protein [Oligoflexia bacterium]
MFSQIVALIYKKKIKSHLILALIALIVLTALNFSQHLFAFDLQQLSYSEEWMRLLHYKKKLFYQNKFESEVDGKDFFLDSNGKFDPYLELQANVRNFSNSNVSVNANLRCRFPARYKWLKSKGVLVLRDHLNVAQDLECEKYHAFLERMRAESVSVVFSSYYLNNPASAFGHTFLRLNKRKNRQGIASRAEELLDYAINFGADITSSNPIIYALGGLSGYFKGTFSAIPYYYKIREYNDYESRDLISYELNLSADELERLLDHIWEVGNTYLDYYFLGENCSYHILTLLEAAKVDLKLTQNLPFYVIPSDTIKELFLNKGLVRSVSFRPSAYTRFYNSVATLSDFEKSILKEILKSNNPYLLDKNEYTFLEQSSKVKILDASLDYFDFKFFKKLLKEDKEILILKAPYLLKRGEMAVVSPVNKIDQKIDESKLPHNGHGSRRLGLSMGRDDKRSSFLQFEYKSALHDILDRVDGYPRNVSLKIGVVNFRMNLNSNNFHLNKLQLFDILSLAPVDQFMIRPSWSASLGYKRIVDRSSLSLSLIGMDGGMGISFSFFSDRAVIYGLVDLDFSVLLSKQRAFMPGIGPIIGLKFDFIEGRISAKLSHQIIRYYKNFNTTNPLNIYSSIFELRWNLMDNFALSAEINSNLKNNEYLLAGFYYF